MMFKAMLIPIFCFFLHCPQVIALEKKQFCLDGIYVNFNRELIAENEEISFSENYLKIPYRERYEYFSDKYKSSLERVFSVNNAIAYETLEKKQNYERIITASKVVAVRTGPNSTVTITLLACWSQEGYSGLDTYILDLKKFESGWKIVNVMK